MLRFKYLLDVLATYVHLVLVNQQIIRYGYKYNAVRYALLIFILYVCTCVYLIDSIACSQA